MHAANNRPAARAAALILGLIFVAQIVIYAPSFRIKPAADDFPYLNEIRRGNTQGIGVFFTQSFTSQTYRPLVSLGLWIAGQVGRTHEQICFNVRAIDFLSMAVYGVVLFAWLRLLRCSTLATIVAGLLLFIHPIVTDSLGSIDGFNSLLSSALLWLGGWMILRFTGNLKILVPGLFLLFLIAAGLKEYVFALLPLAAIEIVLFWPRAMWKRGAIVLATLFVSFCIILVIRHFAIPPGNGDGTGYLSFNPIDWLRNAATFITGLLFLGDSVWVYLHQSRKTLLIVGVVCLATLVVLLIGLSRELMRDAGGSIDLKLARRVLFLLLGIVAGSFPAIVSYHVSEMYVPPMLLPFALLGGIAADGIRRRAPAVRFAAIALGAIALIFSISAISAKVGGLNDVGDRAEQQCLAALQWIPPEAHDQTMVLLFLNRTLDPRRTYSSFRMGDDTLLVHELVPEWFRPGKHLRLQCRIVENFADFDQTDWDYVLAWDAQTKSFARLKPA